MASSCKWRQLQATAVWAAKPMLGLLWWLEINVCAVKLMLLLCKHSAAADRKCVQHSVATTSSYSAKVKIKQKFQVANWCILTWISPFDFISNVTTTTAQQQCSPRRISFELFAWAATEAKILLKTTFVTALKYACSTPTTTSSV